MNLKNQYMNFLVIVHSELISILYLLNSVLTLFFNVRIHPRFLIENTFRHFLPSYHYGIS